MRQANHSAGYKVVQLRPNGQRFYGGRPVLLFVHRLVMLAFHGRCPRGKEVCHRNDRPTDNRVSNLRYDTRRGNLADRERHGTLLRGEDSPTAKLTTAKVVQAMGMDMDGWYAVDIAEFFDVSDSAIRGILKGRTWKHVVRPGGKK
jgi:hypothetical protein